MTRRYLFGPAPAALAEQLQSQRQAWDCLAIGHATQSEATAGVRCQLGLDKWWPEQLEVIEREWEGMVERRGRRKVAGGRDALLAGMWEALGSRNGLDPSLGVALAAALAQVQ